MIDIQKNIDMIDLQKNIDLNLDILNNLIKEVPAEAEVPADVPADVPIDIYKNERAFTHADYVNTSILWTADNGDNTHRLDYPLNKNSVVFDVGGYLGIWSNNIYCKFGCKIFIFEPIPQYAVVIENKFSHNKDVKILRYGLSHQTIDTTMIITGESSSLLLSQQSVEETIEVSVKLKDIVAEILEKKYHRINLLKINIEGAEYSLLDHLLKFKKIMNIIDNIQVQFHIWTKNYEQRRDDIREKLSETHELTYDYPFIWENWRRKQ